MGRYEVVILGGGVNGLIAALALANLSCSVAIVCPSSSVRFSEKWSDGRSFALNKTSMIFLKKIGVLTERDEAIEPISKIFVSSGQDGDRHVTHPCFLSFVTEDASDENGKESLGFMIRYHDLFNALLKRVLNHEKIAIHEGFAHEIKSHEECVSVHLDHQPSVVESDLLIYAAGKPKNQLSLLDCFSFRFFEKDYQQTAIVATVEHERAHEGTAHEFFCPEGPFAILPLPQREKKNYSSIVWVLERRKARALSRAREKEHEQMIVRQEIEHLICRHFGDVFGKVEILDHDLKSHDLGLSVAYQSVDRRVCLLGDAFHGIHPLAGQGLNLGIRDTIALEKAVTHGKNLGLDLGSSAFLKTFYDQERFQDVVSMAAITDLLNHCFSSRLQRPFVSLGLGVVGKCEKLRRFMRDYASRGSL